MQKYIFYNSTTGDIHFIKKMSPSSAHMNCEMNNNVSCVLESEVGVVLNKSKQKIDLDTMTLVTQPVQLQQPSIQDQIRKERTLRLSVCDWTQGADSPLTEEKRAEWATYRQQLRDITTTYASATKLSDVVWPTKPQ